ncbi:asparaginase [Pelosinus sp. UFO1]|uniref:asparaginase n=1 Tax=Pelosinus sp. UFO1 TaxID=484770 RepID=UPI0004D17245|nr:asparaginase [Pelosinus sp. UFO1]AIF50061.1 L-asparaginase II [Pelosinus sp. UFO1]
MSEVLLHYTRGGKVESVHRADVAVVDVTGKMVWEFGDGKRPMFWRSAAKPFQLLPFVEQGGVEKFKITEEEIAFMVSSHSGEAEHVALAHALLAKIGLTIEALACGPAKPMSSKMAKELMVQKQPFQVVHNACSGKHSGMLALAQMLQVAIAGYTELTHPVQQMMYQAVADSVRMQKETVETGIDGCGVPVFYLPLYNMALAYARLAKPEEGQWGQSEKSVRLIRDAMLAHPHVVAGTKRFDTVLMNVTKGRILAKIGSEAVYCLASVPDGLGVTFKIDDGSYRAVNPAGIAILKKLDLLSSAEYQTLVEQFPPVLKNHRGDVIGTVEATI